MSLNILKMGIPANYTHRESNMIIQKSLCDIKPCQTAVIEKISSDCRIKRRLIDTGLTENTEVKCVGQSPGKDMKAYRIRGAVIAIRNEDCKYVFIKGEKT